MKVRIWQVPACQLSCQSIPTCISELVIDIVVVVVVVDMLIVTDHIIFSCGQ